MPEFSVRSIGRDGAACVLKGVNVESIVGQRQHTTEGRSDGRKKHIPDRAIQIEPCVLTVFLPTAKISRPCLPTAREDTVTKAIHVITLADVG